MEQKAPLVSIIMPAYNASSTIQETLQTILQQTYENWELVLIDDGSQDNTCELVALINDNRIHLYREENKGSALARSQGTELAQGKYITFLDADDHWEPNKLEAQVELFQRLHPSVGMIHSNYVEFDHKGFYSPKPLRYCEKLKISGKIYEDLLIHNFIGLLTVIVKKEVIDQVGVFDPIYTGAEDWDLWLRIAKLYEVAYLPSPLARYRLNPHGQSKNYQTYEPGLWKVIEHHLLKANMSQKQKKIGLWLFYRHMAHGFSRNGQINVGFKRLLKAIQVRPFEYRNLLSIGYLCLQCIRKLIFSMNRSPGGQR